MLQVRELGLGLMAFTVWGVGCGVRGVGLEVGAKVCVGFSVLQQCCSLGAGTLAYPRCQPLPTVANPRASSLTLIATRVQQRQP
jgi:hypothetical protein